VKVGRSISALLSGLGSVVEFDRPPAANSSPADR
jgi:hypothetical protein